MKPWPEIIVPCPDAWQGDGVAVELADREIVRLLGNVCLFTPPITEQEIEQYARRLSITKRQAELDIRRRRDDANQR